MGKSQAVNTESLPPFGRLQIALNIAQKSLQRQNKTTNKQTPQIKTPKNEFQLVEVARSGYCRSTVTRQLMRLNEGSQAKRLGMWVYRGNGERNVHLKLTSANPQSQRKEVA